MKPSFFLIAFSILIFSSAKISAQAPAWDWANAAGGGTGNDYGNSISTDANGNSYVTGNFQTPFIVFGSITLNYTDGFFIVKYDDLGNVLWAKTAGGQNCQGTSVCTDANGNCYVTGTCAGTTSFDNITLTTNNTLYNYFVVKLDGQGNAIWAKTSNPYGRSNGNGISTDANGNVFVTGNYSDGDVTFDTITLNNAGPFDDIFVAKYNSSGNIVWVKSMVGSSNDHGTGISTDANGNSFATGDFQSTSLSVGNLTLTNNSGGNAIYVAEYDNSGNVIWATASTGTGGMHKPSISIDGHGNSYITGYFNGNSATFGTTTLINAGVNDIFIVKYDNSGNIVWAKRAGGIDFDEGHSISTDANGNSYITGYYRSSITFGTITFTTLTTAGFADIFVAKYDSSGTVIWAKNVNNGTDPDMGSGISVSNGNAYVTGYFFSPTLGFNFNTISNVDNSGNFANVFVAKIDSSLLSGVNEINNSSDQFQLFPNPSNGKFTIENNFELINGELEIYNSLGQKIYSATISDKQSISVDISSQANGIYVLQLKCKERIVTKKIMVTN